MLFWGVFFLQKSGRKIMISTKKKGKELWIFRTILAETERTQYIYNFLFEIRLYPRKNKTKKVMRASCRMVCLAESLFMIYIYYLYTWKVLYIMSRETSAAQFQYQHATRHSAHSSSFPSGLLSPGIFYHKNCKYRHCLITNIIIIKILLIIRFRKCYLLVIFSCVISKV